MRASNHSRLCFDRVGTCVLYIVLIQPLIKVDITPGCTIQGLSFPRPSFVINNSSSSGPRHVCLSQGWKDLANAEVGVVVVNCLVLPGVVPVNTALVVNHGGFAAEALLATIISTLIR